MSSKLCSYFLSLANVTVVVVGDFTIKTGPHSQKNGRLLQQAGPLKCWYLGKLLFQLNQIPNKKQGLSQTWFAKNVKEWENLSFTVRNGTVKNISFSRGTDRAGSGLYGRVRFCAVVHLRQVWSSMLCAVCVNAQSEWKPIRHFIEYNKTRGPATCGEPELNDLIDMIYFLESLRWSAFSLKVSIQ